MQNQAQFYPVRVVSRSVTRKSAKRTSWFVLGTSFGVGCALFLSTIMSSNSLPITWDVANEAPNLSLSLEENDVSALSTAQSIDIVALPLLPKTEQDSASGGVPVVRGPQMVVAEAPSPVLDTAVAEPTTKPVELFGAKGEVAKVTEAAIAPVAPAIIPDIISAPVAQMASNTAPQPAPNMYPLMLDLKVGTGDTLMNILTDTGVSYQEAHNAVDSIRKLYDPKKLDVGQSVSVILNKGEDELDQPVISSMNVPTSNISSVQVTRDGTGDTGHFAAKAIKEPLFQKPARVSGKIESSLYETGMQRGIPANILGELINAYSYDVDFQRDIHQGDKIDVVFDRMQTKDGTVAGNGNLLYADLVLGGKPMKIYRYSDKAGNADYYNEKGESIRKALLRTPINGAKITSGFGMRSHPILGYSKMHRGVDFGAPTGTPIYAAGDGVVSFAGTKGGYGNYLNIKHDTKYSSAYGHISRFATGMAPGKKVKQGQIVAYVGSTGQSTGPHLHYEILVNNAQVNPAGVKFKTGNVLGGKELAAFRTKVAQVQAVLAAPENKTLDVASNK